MRLLISVLQVCPVYVFLLDCNRKEAKVTGNTDEEDDKVQAQGSSRVFFLCGCWRTQYQGTFLTWTNDSVIRNNSVPLSGRCGV